METTEYCKLLNESEIREKIKNLSTKEKKEFFKSLELIQYIERGRDTIYLPLSDYMINFIETICFEKQNKEILEKLKHKINRINLIRIGSIVEFAASSYTVVKVDRDKREIDIKQNFSIGLIYEKIGIFEVRFLK